MASTKEHMHSIAHRHTVEAIEEYVMIRFNNMRVWLRPGRISFPRVSRTVWGR